MGRLPRRNRMGSGRVGLGLLGEILGRGGLGISARSRSRLSQREWHGGRGLEEGSRHKYRWTTGLGILGWLSARRLTWSTLGRRLLRGLHVECSRSR